MDAAMRTIGLPCFIMSECKGLFPLRLRCAARCDIETPIVFLYLSQRAAQHIVHYLSLSLTIAAQRSAAIVEILFKRLLFRSRTEMTL